VLYRRAGEAVVVEISSCIRPSSAPQAGGQGSGRWLRCGRSRISCPLIWNIKPATFKTLILRALRNVSGSTDGVEKGLPTIETASPKSALRSLRILSRHRCPVRLSFSTISTDGVEKVFIYFPSCFELRRLLQGMVVVSQVASFGSDGKGSEPSPSVGTLRWHRPGPAA